MIVLDASAVAWFVQNLGGEAGWRLSLVVAGAASLTVILAWLAGWARRLLQALEDA